jgi:hypothetical protein
MGDVELALSLEVQNESNGNQQTIRGHRYSKAKSTKRIVLGTGKPSTFQMP